MNYKMKEIMEALSDKPDFIEKMNDINTIYPDIYENIHEFVKLVKEYGYDITEEEIDALCDLSQSELNQVACRRMNCDGTTTCWCVAGGGGVADEWQKSCGCVVGGGGRLTDAGKKKFPNNTYALMCVRLGMF